MEKMNKEQNIGSSTNQETVTNDMSNEEQNTSNLPLVAKNTKTGSPSHGNATLLNQQYPPVLQWPYIPNHVEQSSSLSSGPCVSTQSPSPVAVSTWQQLSHPQPNLSTNQVQQGLPPSHVAQSAMPFWLPPRPAYPSTAVNVPGSFQTFAPLGTISANWQAPAMIGGVTSSSNQPHVSDFCYPVGYPHPGVPGPWDPSSWYAQGRQLQPSSMYTLPGGYGYLASVPPPLPGCAAAPLGQSSQRGLIRPTVKLSQKHHQLWEAQSAENVQLWTVIGQLQTELAEYKGRQMKLEAEVSSLKPAVEEPIAQVTKAALSKRASKRGRPRRSAASVELLVTPDESCTQARGRKPVATLRKVQPYQARNLIFEKVVLNKVEKKEKKSHSPATAQQQSDENISNIVTDSNVNIEVNGSNLMMPPGFNNQLHCENPQIPGSGIELSTSSKVKSIDDKTDDSTGKNTRGLSITQTGTAVVGSFGWSSNSVPGNCGRNFFNMSYQDFYDNGSGISQGGKHVPAWSFVNEENASEPINDAVVGSAKDGNEQEMGDEASSGDEEIAGTQDEAAYTWMVR